MLIHQGKILSDDTTLEQNGVMDSSFLVIILKKVDLSFTLSSSEIDIIGPMFDLNTRNKKKYVINLSSTFQLSAFLGSELFEENG